MQCTLRLPESEELDCLSCSFVKGKEGIVAAYSDGGLVMWDLRKDEVTIQNAWLFSNYSFLQSLTAAVSYD